MTKERLRAYRDLRQERDKLKKLIEELALNLYGPSSPNLDGMPRSHGGGSATENLVAQKDQIERKYEAKVAELTAELEAIEQSIEVLEPRERTLIRLYYIEGLTWEQVCVEMSYSWMQIHRIHGKALERLRTQEEVAGA